MSTAEVIDALGGNAAAAKLLGVKYNVVTNWRIYGAFPANTYVLLRHLLSERGQAAPDYLWRMRKTRPAGKRKTTT